MNVDKHVNRLHVLFLVGYDNVRKLGCDADVSTEAAATWIAELGASTMYAIRAELLAQIIPLIETRLAQASATTAAERRLGGQDTAFRKHNQRPHGPYRANRTFHSLLVGVFLSLLAVVLAAALVATLASAGVTTGAEVLAIALAALCSGCAGDWAGRSRTRLAIATALSLVPLSAAVVFVVAADGPHAPSISIVDALVVAFACGAGLLVGRHRVETPMIRADERELASDLALSEATERTTVADDAASVAIEAAEATYAEWVGEVRSITRKAFDIYAAERTGAGISFQDAGALRAQVARIVAAWPDTLGLDDLAQPR
jgi:hypothetical protein